MYNREKIFGLVKFIAAHDGIGDKKILAEKVRATFNLFKDGKVFHCEDFAVRFCKAETCAFGNTVLALSKLRKFDDVPFMICIVTPEKNYLLLANTTFLRKISHSSQALRVDNVKGSFNGSDIMREFDGLINMPENFGELFALHENFTPEENLERLVEATNNIKPARKKFLPDERQIACILNSVERAENFLASKEYKILSEDLRRRVNAVAEEISIAANIDNVNLRGRVIEYLITSDDTDELIHALHTGKTLPKIFTAYDLGDYKRRINNFNTATDVKSKILRLSSNPKGYNVDKLLEFLAQEDSVYLIYVVAVNEHGKVFARLCSMFNRQILNATRIIPHWAGRNRRGVTQFNGTSLEDAVFDFEDTIDVARAEDFLEELLWQK